MKKTAMSNVLRIMTESTPTCLWNDSCSVTELRRSIENGAVGATCNPVIVVEVLKKEWETWRDRIPAIFRENPELSEEQVAWRIVEAVSQEAASLLEPVYHAHRGRNGRLSIQTDPRLYRSSAALVEQAVHFSELAPNIIVKIPATFAGIAAIEEATYLGISVNATVSFSVPQALAVAEAVERGLKRREEERCDVSRMGPVCTIMVGRLDDWLKYVAEKCGIIATPGILEWAGVAVMKRAYQLYRERGYRLRLLSAAFRNHLHWSQFIGGDVVISPPWKWQERFIASDITADCRMDDPVDPAIICELSEKFRDFRRSYDVDGMMPSEFDAFGPTVRTLRQFCQATHELCCIVREQLLNEAAVLAQ
jgi:transaldolase